MTAIEFIFPKVRAEILRFLFADPSREYHLRQLSRHARFALRNTAEYDSSGCVSIDEAHALVAFATVLRQDVKAWLRDNHPELS